MTSAIRLIPAIPACALMLAGAAQAETRTSLVIGAEGGYDSNPYFDASQPDQGAGTLTLSATPTIQLIGPTSTINLGGGVDQAFYTSRYPDHTNWQLNGDAAVRVSPRTSLSLGAGYTSQVNTGSTAQSSVIPSPDPDVPLPDPTFTETGGQRTKTLYGSAGIESQISPRDTLSFSATASKVDFPATYNSDNKSYGGSAGLSHVFSDRMSGGLSVSYNKTDYDQATFGAYKAISPSANMTLKLAPRTTLNLSAGATFNEVAATATAPSSSKTFFSGSASLCHQGDRSNICLAGSRSVGSTAQSGSSTVTQISGDYSYTLSPRSTVRLGANYSASQSTGLGPSFDSSYAGGFASYDHQLTQRFSLRLNARYTNPIKSIGIRRESFYGGVGLTYRFGH